jgi:Mrp family chromosome partitioning ATPase
MNRIEMKNLDKTTKAETECSTCGQSECSAKSKGAGETDRQFAERQAVARRMCRIDHKILVLSGKGGVGKSTVAVNLAASLVLAGKRVGIMDIDIHGPSVPKLLNVNSAPAAGCDGAIQPVEAFEGLKVMSIGFFLPHRDDAVIWRGPRKYSLIRQFLSEVDWGELDYLIVDSPPGTGDEPLSIAQLIGEVDGAVIVTTPQELAVDDVRRSINFCRQLEVPVIGVVENMSGFVCPHCGKESEIFKRGGGAAMADQMKVPYMGAVPIDPEIVKACDDGVPYIRRLAGSRTALAFQKVIEPLLNMKERIKS